MSLVEVDDLDRYDEQLDARQLEARESAREKKTQKGNPAGKRRFQYSGLLIFAKLRADWKFDLCVFENVSMLGSVSILDSVTFASKLPMASFSRCVAVLYVS